MLRAVVALGALYAALGVAAAAAGAHLADGARLMSAAAVLLAEAPLLVAAAAAWRVGILGGRLAAFGLGAGALGTALFAGDLALRVFAATRLFPDAAPTGGSLLILGWLAVALGSLAGRRSGEG